jgi:hypothetical protein
MKIWKLAATVAVGVFASASGSIQVDAATFAYQVDFIDKEVANFNDFKQVFNANTYDLNAKVEWTWAGTYYMDSCSSAYNVNISWNLNYRLNGTGGFTEIALGLLPDFTCNTAPTLYTSTVFASLPDAIVLALVNDDANYVQFNPGILISRDTLIGTTLNFENYTNYFNVFYEFDTTYLFNYFLSDQQYAGRGVSTPARWSFGATRVSYLEYVYTTAGNDTYIIENSLIADIGTTRKKYAINVDDLYFRGESVGAQFETRNVFGVDRFTPLVNGTEIYNQLYNYFYLNTSNYQQPLADVPQFNFTEEDCGSFLALNVGCFINNGLAYVVNDAPIISDIFTLLNTGMQLGGQAFAVLGNFTDNNLIGVLVLGGAGLTAVRWFLKQD